MEPTHQAEGSALQLTNIKEDKYEEEQPPSSLPEESGAHHPQTVELESTIDPSHIIHLIRQLLPVHGGQPRTQECNEPNTVPTRENPQEDGTATVDIISAQRDDNHKEPIEGKTGRRVDNEEACQPDKTCGTHNLSLNASVFREESDDKIGADEDSGEEELREQAGCVLWDLAASESQADFLVDNHILDVLLAILNLPQSERMREICLGILGNLACHSKAEKAMVTVKGLINTVIEQLQSDDPPILSEACRLLSAALHSDAANAWVVAIKEEEVLERIMWMASNTMNPQLREKSTELLLAMVDSKPGLVSILLPVLLHLGLPELLTDLIECELIAIKEGTSSCGDAVLDTVLQIAEALSLFDECAAQLVSNQKLFSLTCQVICLSFKDEIGPSGITAIVLIANLLTEKSNLIQDILQDEKMVKHLLALLPMVSDDPGARNALWSILERVSQHFLNRRPELPLLSNEASVMVVFADNSSSLMDDLDDHREDDEEEDEKRASSSVNADSTPSCGRQSKLSTVQHIAQVMEDWLVAETQNSTHGEDTACEIQRAHRLLTNYTASPDSVMHDRM